MPYEVSVDATVARGSEELMKTHAVLAAVLLMLGSAPATATVRIANDTGGQIGPYLAKYRALRASGERVEIDGTCASACTMLLGIIPRNRICITPRASLLFHSAWDMEGDQAVASEGSRILWSTYPESPKACAGGSNRTAGCILKLSR